MPAAPSLGPVADLEVHLSANWWKTLFGPLYLKTDGDVVENDENTSRETDLLVQAASLAPAQRILDLCCGQGRHSIELARRGYGKVTGLDQAGYLIRLARKRAAELGEAIKPPKYKLGHADALPFKDHAFDCVAIMGNSFGYFAHEDNDNAVLHEARRVLAPGGVLVLDLCDGDWMRDNFDPRSWEWIDADHLACRERQMSADSQRVVCREIVIHTKRGVIADQFYAIRHYTRDHIRAKLAALGYVEVEQHCEFASLSDRNQDLGFMENRMFITARVPPA